MAAKKRQFLAMKTSQGTPAAATSELPSSSSRIPSKLSLLVTFLCMCVANGFAPAPPLRTPAATLHMSYYDMSDYSSGPADNDDDSEVGAAKVTEDPEAPKKAQDWVAALGGSANLKEIKACAATRVRVVVADAAKVDKMRLEAAGVQAVMVLPDGAYHLIVGLASDQYAREMKKV